MTIQVVILGASGLVGAELMRLVARHEHLELKAACSRSKRGQPVGEVHRHLVDSHRQVCFVDPAKLDFSVPAYQPIAVLSALPHGQAASVIDLVIMQLQKAECDFYIVDLSADFRLEDVQQWQEIYGAPHGAPHRMKDFHCGLPDLGKTPNTKLVAHPGCFTTAVTLACAPLVDSGISENRFVASCVTGSTGSGRSEKPSTHHPRRQSNMWSYQPLTHRHTFEMDQILKQVSGKVSPKVVFVPHSGPFSRGIHATIVSRLHEPMAAEEVVAMMTAFYEGRPGMRITTIAPDLKDVVGSNAIHMGVHVLEKELVVCAVIDNLLKGAAGGAIHWLNRLAGFPESAGLEDPGWGWC